MRLWRFALILAVLIIFPVLLEAGQIAFDYNTVPRTIRACQLLIPDGYTSANPYVLPTLARSNLRPAGWTFENPLAPTNVTADIFALWEAPGHSPGLSGAGYWAGRGMPAGSALLNAVPPEWPQYWEVVLDNDTAEQLTQFDLIYIAHVDPGGLTVSIISPVQRAGLRQAVENGAVLWVDYAGAAVTSFPVPRNAVPAPFAFGALGGSLTDRVAVDPGHALLSSPFALTAEEIRQVGDWPDGPAGPLGAFQVLQPAGNDVPLLPVVDVVTNSATGVAVAAAGYGSGAIVATAGAVGEDIEEWYLVGAQIPTPRHQPDLKLAYNIANFARAWKQAGGGPSNLAVDLAEARPPLDMVWQFPAPWDVGLPPVGPLVSSPVVSEGRIVVVSTFGGAGTTPTLYCLDSALSAGSYLLYWSNPLGGYTPRASSPTAATVGGLPAVLISAVDPGGAAGAVSAYDLVGALLWTYVITGYAGSAEVINLSSPVVYKNWVFVIADEYDSSLSADEEGTYSRVHCIDLLTGGSGAISPWIYPDPARGEAQRLLPPLHDPVWVADAARGEIPPEGDVRPAISTNLTTPLGTPVEAALLFHTPRAFRFSAGSVSLAPGVGAQYAFIPTPLDGAGAALLNADYYTARLNAIGITSVDAANRDEAGGAAVMVNGTPLIDANGVEYAYFNNVADVLTQLAITSAAPPYDNPLTLQRGCRVQIDYTATAAVTDEVHFLPGPVAWVRRMGGNYTAERSGTTIVGGPTLQVLSSEEGRLQARWEPNEEFPNAPGGLWASDGRVRATVALDTDTVVAAADFDTMASVGETVGGVYGLRTQPDLNVHLGPGLLDSIAIAAGSTVGIDLLEVGPVPAAAFEVDYVNRMIRFTPNAAATVAGKALLVDWDSSAGVSYTDELHVAPRLSRFEYVGGFIRLRHYPVILGSVSIQLADGSPISGWTEGETSVSFDLDGNGAALVLPNGWIDLSDPTIAFVTDALGVTHSVVGKEVIISYTGWSEADGGLVTVDIGATYPPERQQVPFEIGHSRGGVAVSGRAAAVGTLGVEDGLDYITPLGGTTPAETLLSVLWNPVTHLVKGWLSRPAYEAPGLPPHPSIYGAPSSYAGRVYVGTAQRPDDPLAVPTAGYLGCLGPRRTLICDGNRLVETVGAERTWVLTGSRASIYGRTAPEPLMAQPFNRPAKAHPRGDGTFLVADTGNNRVIVVDRQGNQVWPADEFGFDYYSSPARADATVPGGVAGNFNLKLAQPADAYRYVDAGGLIHTVIADTGHNRVVDVITTSLGTASQQHAVVQLTPSHVRPPWDPTRHLKLRYTRAQPIFDFGTGVVGGYLCAAANLDRVVIVEAGSEFVDPDPSTVPPGGSVPWSYWSWLYAIDFVNLRHVEYFRYGTSAYVVAVAGGIGGVNQDGVWVWEINTTSGLIAGGGPFGSTWSYLDTDYAGVGAFSTVVTPAGVTYPKRFYPVCAKVLYPGLAFGGNVLITNYTGLTEHLSRQNVGSPGTELFGEVFEVDGAGTLLEERAIPDPWAEEWDDPLNQPAYATRY